MRMYGIENFVIELYQEIIILNKQNKKDMYILEGIAQIVLGSTLNTNIAGRTSKQFYLDNRETISTKANTKNICDVCNGRYTNRNKATHFKSNKHNETFC